MAATLPKEERLSGRTAIARLTGSGRWSQTPHLRCCCLQENGLDINRIMVSVPKRYFKRAVKRNLLKRRMREAFRRQKALLGPGVDALFIYTSSEVRPYEDVYADMTKLLTHIGNASGN